MDAMFLFAQEADKIPLPPWAVTLLGIVLSVYVLILIGLSFYTTGKVQNEEDYLVAGRRLPLLMCWGTLIATWFGAASMSAAAQTARDDGLRATVLDPWACAGTLVLAGLFFARPLWKMKLLTMGDFFRTKYGERAEIAYSIVQVPAYFGWIALQFVAIKDVLHVYFGISATLGLLLAVGVTLLITMSGGMWSVTLTDTIQILLAFCGLLILGYVAFQAVGDGSFAAGMEKFFDYYSTKAPDSFTLSPKPIDQTWGTFLSTSTGWAVMFAYIGSWATGLLGNIPGQDLQQRVFSAKSETVASRTCVLAGVTYLAFGMIPLSMGLLSRLTHPGEIRGTILTWMAGEFLNPVLAIVFLLAFVSIVVSTATSAVLAPATILGHNLLSRLEVFRNAGLLRDRLCVLVICMGGLSLALWGGESLLGLLDLTLSIQLTALFIPVAFGIYGRPRGQISATAAILTGFGFFLVRYLVEKVFWPAPDEFGGEYFEYFAANITSSPIAKYSLMVPADLWGLGACAVAFTIGHFVDHARPTQPTVAENAAVTPEGS